MEHVMIFTPSASAFELMHELGNKGVMQFDDLNKDKTAFDRTYAPAIKRCEELERMLVYFKTEIDRMELKVPFPPGVDKFLSRANTELQDKNMEVRERLKQMVDDLASKEEQLRKLNAQYEILLREYNKKRELKYVLSEGLKQMGTDFQKQETIDDSGARIRFSRVTGVVNSLDRTAFERMVFRFSRGSCFIQFFDIYDGPEIASAQEEGLRETVLFTDPKTGKGVSKMVFIAVFPGSALRDKISNICDAFGASIHDVPDAESVGAVESDKRDVLTYLHDAGEVLTANRLQARSLLQELTANYNQWLMRVKTMKGVFYTLNKCYVRKTGFVVARGWMLADKMEEVQDLVHRCGGEKGGGISRKKTDRPAPTFFQTNKFTKVFQETVDIYGVPRYQEANPALFTAVTFPFLFGVMFGDVGHGTLFLLFSLYFIVNESSLAKMKMDELMNMAYQGRYMLMLMGIFATYCGFVYNECFCLAMDIFGSKWTTNATMDEYYTNGDRAYLWTVDGVEGYGNQVYSFGVDPTWHVSKNELTFLNSYKMKLSVLLGVTQMTAGICLKWSNAIYYKDDLTFIFECIPQMLFMLCLFVYMDILIIYKWCINWQEAFARHEEAPSLINTMINMALQMGGRGDEAALYSSQDAVQPVLLAVAFLCIPVMLIPKPILMHKRMQAKKAKKHHGAEYSSVNATEEKDEEEDLGKGAVEESHGHHEEETLMDLCIEQCIETIEFVLSCVSNTASYLRLWALSLAHAELAKTFWEQTMAGSINSESSFAFVYITVGYVVFAFSTLCVLLVMDPLECVLHALRLHWVEFQNKFYKADGYAFKPFCYKSILTKVFQDEQNA